MRIVEPSEAFGAPPEQRDKFRVRLDAWVLGKREALSKS
jgi:hypothetical protein